MTKTPSKRAEMLWNAAGNITYLGCQWIMTVLVTILGGLTDAGILSIAMSVSATFQTLGAFGIRNFQVSDINGQYSDSCYVALRVLTCAVTLPICLIFSLCNRYFGGQLIAILLFMLFRLSECFSDVLHGIAQKNERLDIAGKSFALKGVGLLACFLVGFYLTKQLNIGLACMMLFSACVTFLYDLPAVRKLSSFSFTVPLRESFGLARNTLSLCIYMFLSAAIATLPKLILGKLCGEDVLGAYSSIFAPALLISAAAGYLYTPFIPNFAVAYREGNSRRFIGMFFKIVFGVSAFALLTLLVAWLIGDRALILLFGDRIIPYTDLLIPILVSIFVNAIFGFLCVIEVVLRDFAGLLAGCGAGLLLEAVITGAWIQRGDINATSYAYILSCAVAALLLFACMLYHLYGKKKKESNHVN